MQYHRNNDLCTRSHFSLDAAANERNQSQNRGWNAAQTPQEGGSVGALGVEAVLVVMETDVVHIYLCNLTILTPM